MATNNAQTPGSGIDASEVLETLVIKKVQRRTSCGGAWVIGTIAGHRFDALVFPEPATNREWEVGGDSRISKLWLQRISDRHAIPILRRRFLLHSRPVSEPAYRVYPWVAAFRNDLATRGNHTVFEIVSRLVARDIWRDIQFRNSERYREPNHEIR